MLDFSCIALFCETHTMDKYIVWSLVEEGPEVLLVFVCGEDAFGVDVSLDTVSGHLEVLVLSKLEVLEEGSREEFLVDERETVLSVLLEVGEPVEWK